MMKSRPFLYFTFILATNQGCDRVLLGLRFISEEAGWGTPAVFKDAGWARSTNWQLSTSQMSSEGFYVGFGPVSDEGEVFYEEKVLRNVIG
jgi:hypothetical protein